MSDDIETLRTFIGDAERFGQMSGKDARAALERLVAEAERWQAVSESAWKSLDAELNIGIRQVPIVKQLLDAEAERDSLRKALDDRFSADQRAARAIFAETGRERGFPSVKDVVAYYIAEAERLEKERGSFLEMANELDAIYGVLGTADAEGGEQAAHTIDCLLTECDSLRAKLERAIAALKNIRKNNWTEHPGLTSECGSSWTQGHWSKIAEKTLAELSAGAPAQQTQISPALSGRSGL